MRFYSITFLSVALISFLFAEASFAAKKQRLSAEELQVVTERLRVLQEEKSLPPLFQPVFKDRMMLVAIRDFWQNALDSNGQKMKPYNEYERTHPLLPPEQGYEVIDSGYYAGMSAWCGTKGKEYFREVQRLRKAKYDWNVKRSGYAARLFGIARDFTLSELNKRKDACDEPLRNMVAKATQMDVQGASMVAENADIVSSDVQPEPSAPSKTD